MFHAKNYIKVTSLEEAYELNQKKSNAIIGGMLWLKMSNRNMQTAIDLSGLGLDKIEEQEDAFSIGCMCTLRQLEIHEALNRYFGGAMKACTRHIVGTQFRNGATVGGSIFGRFGFSDILTCLLALDTYVELYHAGVIALSEFVEMPRDNDILVRIIIKKDGRKIAYRSHREAATDFPVIACAVANKDVYTSPVGNTRSIESLFWRRDESLYKTYCRYTVPQWRNGWRKHFWKIWIFGYIDLSSGIRYICGIISCRCDCVI